jgi:hypothetical protein
MLQSNHPVVKQELSQLVADTLRAVSGVDIYELVGAI